MLDAEPSRAGDARPRGTASAEARRRYLTILFSDLCNSTPIACELEAEDYAELIGALQALYRDVVPRHGGTLAQISGDGVLALFGYPDTREDDVRRAAAAALDLHAAASRLAVLGSLTGLRLHSGIHAGLILLDDGDPVRGRFSALGQSTNMAAHLCAAAGADEILIGEATLGRDRRYFATGPPRVLRPKGRARPIRVLPVLRRASPVAPGRTIGGFVGRREELDALDQWLEDGAPPVAAAIGPAGIGKTRLGEEFLARARAAGWDVHRGSCDPQAEPLSPIREILRSIGSAEDTAGAAPVDEPAGVTGRTLADMVLAAGRKRRLVLFLDDWHLADDATRDVIDLLRTPNDAPVRMLVTARDRSSLGGAATAALVLTLAPLTPDETAAAVRHLLPGSDPFLLGRITASSGGNPLYVEEVCHWLERGGSEERRIEHGIWLNGLIASRLAKLPAAERALVQAASVIGTTVPGWLLEQLTGHRLDDPLVATLAEEDFLLEGERPGTLRFKHGVTREVVYVSVGAPARAALHGRIARALRRQAEPDDDALDALAYHYSQSGDAAETARYAELAGDRAASASALDRAQAHYRTALGALDRLPDSPETAYRWGLIAQRLGRAGVFDPSPQQLPVFTRAVERARARGDDPALAWAEYWLGHVNYTLGRSGAAIDHYGRALAAATATGNGALVTQVQAALGQAKVVAGDYNAALPLLDLALTEKRRHWTGDRPAVALAYTLACKGFALGDLGRFDEAHASFEEALVSAYGDRDVEGSIFSQRSGVCLWQGDIDAAADFAARAGTVSRRLRSLYFAAMSRALAAYAQWRRSRDPAVIPALLEATRWLELSGKRQFLSLNYGWLTEVLVAAGRTGEALRPARRALVLHRRNDSLGAPMACRAMARAAHDAGREGEARALIAVAAQAAERRCSPHEMAANARCAAELGVDLW